MKKIFLSLLTIFMVLSLSVVLVKAEEETLSSVELSDKISVRTDANVGIKWKATVANPKAGQAYGFLFAQGDVQLLDANSEGVEKVETTELLEGNVFRATMVKFPKSAVAQDITVRAYIRTNEEYIYSDYIDVRNLAETTLYAKNQGLDGAGLNNVVTYLENNYMRTYNIGGTKYLVKPIYEYEPTELAKEFIKDWNSVMGQNIDTMSGWASNNKNGASGSVSKDVILNTNIYKFFNNGEKTMFNKWGWLLDYIPTVSNNSFAITQAKYIKGEKELADSANADWYGSQHLISRIENFFTRKSVTAGLSYQSSFFTTNNEYANLISTIEALPNKVYSTYNSDFVKVGSSIQLLEQPEVSIGYAWDGFTANEEVFEAESDYVVTNSSAVFVPTTHAIEYTVTYMDGENVIEILEPATYKITSSTFTLPKYSKDGHLFKGWYSDSEFTEEVTQVSKGSYGNKVFYAKFEAGYVINYNYNGGYINYGSKAEVVADLFADLSEYNGSSVTPTSMKCYSGPWSLNNFYKFFQNDTYRDKWLWLVELFAEKETVESVKNGLLYLLGQKSWNSNYAYAIDYVVCAFGNNYQYTKNSNYLTYDYSQLEDSIIIARSLPTEVEVSGLGTITTLPTLKTNQKGYEFVGWYDNEEFAGAVITQVSSNVTLYAKFELANYSITFNCGDGKALVQLPTTYTFESETIILPTAQEMSIENGTFVGWFTNEECTGDPVTEIAKGSAGNVVLYAGWLMDTAVEVVLTEADAAALNKLEPTIVVSSEFGLGKFDVNGIVYEAGVAAFTTISEALTAAVENDKIYVFANTYNETLTVSTTGVTIYGPNYGIHGNTQRNAEVNITAVMTISANGVVIDGVKFTEAGNIRVSANNVTITNIYMMPEKTIAGNTINRQACIVDGANISDLVISNSYINAPGSVNDYTKEYVAFNNVTNLTIHNNYITNRATTYSGSSNYEGARVYTSAGVYNITNNVFHWATDGYVLYLANVKNVTELNIVENVFDGNETVKHTATLAIRTGSASTVTNIVGNEFYNFAGSSYAFNNDTGSTVNSMYNYFDENTNFKIGTIASAKLNYVSNGYAATQTTATSDYGVLTTLEQVKEAYNAYKQNQEK